MAHYILQIHSIWRWIVLLFIIIVAIKMLAGWLGKQKWTGLDANLLRYTRYGVYLQVLLGLTLFILLQKWTNMRFVSEHVVVALLAVGGVEFGSARAKKVAGAANKFKFAFIGFIIALLLIFTAIGGTAAR